MRDLEVRPRGGEGDAFHAAIETLDAEDIADGVTFMVTRPRHTAVGELWIMPTEQV